MRYTESQLNRSEVSPENVFRGIVGAERELDLHAVVNLAHAVESPANLSRGELKAAIDDIDAQNAPAQATQERPAMPADNPKAANESDVYSGRAAAARAYLNEVYGKSDAAKNN